MEPDHFFALGSGGNRGGVGIVEALGMASVVLSVQVGHTFEDTASRKMWEETNHMSVQLPTTAVNIVNNA